MPVRMEARMPIRMKARMPIRMKARMGTRVPHIQFHKYTHIIRNQVQTQRPTYPAPIWCLIFRTPAHLTGSDCRTISAPPASRSDPGQATALGNWAPARPAPAPIQLGFGHGPAFTAQSSFVHSRHPRPLPRPQNPGSNGPFPQFYPGPIVHMHGAVLHIFGTCPLSNCIKCKSNATQIKVPSNSNQMGLGSSNTNQTCLVYQIQIKCSHHQIHIKCTPNQIPFK